MAVAARNAADTLDAAQQARLRAESAAGHRT
jgi:hypothetical protein